MPEALPAYVPVLVLGAAAVGFAVFVVVVSQLIGRSHPSSLKSSTYECGVPPIGDARKRFPVKFYLVCMVFILLDVDAAFVYPWAVAFRDLTATLGPFVFIEMLVFVALLSTGFVYAWRTGALDW